MAARVSRILVFLVAVLPILATIAAPDLDGLSRSVSRLFRPASDVVPPTSSPLFPTSRLTWTAAQDRAASLQVDATEFQPLRIDSPLRLPPPARSESTRGPLISSLYVSFGVLQALDAHSTIRALDRGAREGNPVVAPFADNRPALIALKAGTAAGVLYMTDRVWRHNRMAGIVIMVAANSAYATIVARNYRLGTQLER